MNSIVIGGLGFVGVELVSRLKSEGHSVIVIDIDIWNRSHSNEAFMNDEAISVLKVDHLNWGVEAAGKLDLSVEYSVWHLAANSDISKGATDYAVDYELTLGSTIQVIELCKRIKVVNLHFTSTSAVYGEGTKVHRFTENDVCNPISNYGISKYASELFLKKFCDESGIDLYVYRLANIIGRETTHGVILDFKKKLTKDATRLEVLGDGKQTKTYLLVERLVDIMWHFHRSVPAPITVNIGCGDEGVSVASIAELVRAHVSPEALIEYQNKDRGWVGDSPISLLDNTKLKTFYTNQIETSDEAVKIVIEQSS